MNYKNVRRRGNHIALSTGITATEGRNGLPTLTIRKNGKVTAQYSGSSLYFASPTLTQEDKKYLAFLAGLD